MEWVWELYKGYVIKQLARRGQENPSDDEIQDAFMRLLSKSTATVLVQEPWQGSVRFKALAKYEWKEMMPLLQDPMAHLQGEFGGGKFKINFHEGWNFIATQNFKPEGEHLWLDLAEIEV